MILGGAEEVHDEYGIDSVKSEDDLLVNGYGAIVLAVAHREF